MASTSLADLIRDVDPSKSDFALLPPGDYEAELFEIELTKSSNKNPMFKIVYKVTDEEFKNRRLFHQITFTETNAGISVRQMLASGAPSQNDIADALGDQKAALALGKAMVGSACLLHVYIDDGRKFDGKERNKISNVSAVENATKAAFSDDDEKPAKKKGKKAAAAAAAAVEEEKPAAKKGPSRPATPF